MLDGLQPVLDAGLDIDGKHYDIKLIRKDNQSNPNRSAMANDSDGVAMSRPEVGMAAHLRGHGMEVIDLGLFEPMSDDFSAQIGKLKDAQVDILMGVFVPPDWVTFWAQAAQQGFRPKAATIAKALLFPSSVEAVGPAAEGLSTEIWWSPGHPFKSSITGQSSKDFADAYTAQTGRQWVQPKGFKHALIEVGLDVLQRSGDPMDPGAVVESIRGTDLDTMVGRINFIAGPVPNVSATPLVGGQWRKGEKFPFDLAICENKYAPEIPVQSEMRPLS